MTIELPEGAKSFSLPNGQTIDVPMGAKSIDLPDELMKPTQYSGGFNQPQKQGWTQDEVNSELQQPWQKFLSGISSGVGKAYDTVKDIPTSPAEYMTRKALEASSDKYKQGFKEFDKQQEAMGLMAREDALDESSKWSQVYDSFFGDNKEQLNADTRARLARKYDDTFKASGLGRLGEDDNGDYYLIEKDGNNVPLNSFTSKLMNDMKANGGTMGASFAGGMTGARYGASLPIADPRLKALATTIGALGGSAVGAFTGSVGDTAVNASRNGREFDIDFALKKATEEAVADGLIGGTVELGIKGAKAVGGLTKGAKEYVINGNLNGARSLATKEAGINPSDIHASRSAYETVPNESARELSQDELASAAMSRERLWNEVAPEVKGDVKASTEVANTTTSRANSLLEQAEKGAIEPEEVIKQIKAYENDVKTTYGQMVDDIAKIAPDFKATNEDIQLTLANAIENVIGTETDAQLKKILNIVQKQDSHSVQDLFALRKKVNAISTDNFEDLSVIRQLNEQLNDKIGAAIDTIPDATMAARLKEGFNQNRQRYAEMSKMQDQDIYKDIMKSSINPEQASKKLMYYAKAYQDRLNEITKNIAPEARAGIEMRVITDAIKDSLIETSDGFKAIEFKSLNELIKKINTSSLKSENAKVLLETIHDMSKLFGLDAQMLTDVAKGAVKQPSSGIATTIAGKFDAVRTSFATKLIVSYFPTQRGKSLAFKKHVLESLRKARSPKEFLTLAEQYPNAPKTIWKQMRQTIDEYEQKLAEEQEIAFKQQEQEQIAKEARMAEKEAEKARQAEELKARAETTEFSTEELRALTDMTSSNNERQAAMRLMQGKALDGDKATVLALKEKLGTKLDDEMARRAAREEELRAMREQAKRDAEFIKANQGSVQTGKSLSNADINSKFVSDEDARAAAYQERFAGKGGTEHQGTAETLTAKEQKSIDDGTATEDTLLKQRRIKQELEAKGVTGNTIIDGITNRQGYIGSPVANAIIGGGTGSLAPIDYNQDGEVSAEDRALSALLGAVGATRLAGKFAKGAKQAPKEAPNGMRNGMIVGATDDEAGAFSDLLTKKVMREVDDSGSMLNQRVIEDIFEKRNINKPTIKEGEYKSYELQNFLKHDVLYEKYPNLKTIPLIVENNPNASYGGRWNGQYLTLNISQKRGVPKDTLLHEVQHVIQEIEKMPIGGSKDDFVNLREKSNGIHSELNKMDDATGFNDWWIEQQDRLKQEILQNGKVDFDAMRRDYAREFLTEKTAKTWFAKREEAQKILSENKKILGLSENQYTRGFTDYENYRRLYGEQMARATEYRKDMTPEQRAKESWQQTLERVEGKYEEPIIRYDDGVAMSKDPRTERMMEWHKDSHPLTKNEDGTPKVFYHGTGADFSEFRQPSGGIAGKGIYFTDDSGRAGGYARSGNASVMPVYLNIKKPFLIKDTEKVPTQTQLKKSGYDGIIYSQKWNNGEVTKEYIAFDPTQIKSIHNKGTFDETNPNILKSLGLGALGLGAVEASKDKKPTTKELLQKLGL